jgi:hypothetical protein
MKKRSKRENINEEARKKNNFKNMKNRRKSNRKIDAGTEDYGEES